MAHDPHHQQRPEQIRRIIGHNHHSPQQHDKHQYDGDRPEESQLLADDGKNHIVLGLGDEIQFLHALSQPLAPDAPGTNGVEGLQCLEPLALGKSLRVPPGQDALASEVQLLYDGGVKNGPYDADHHRRRGGPHDHEPLIVRSGHKNHQHGNAQYDNGRTHIIRNFPDGQRMGDRQSNQHGQPFRGAQLFSHQTHHIGQKQNHTGLCHLRRLYVKAYTRDPHPSPGAVGFHPQRCQHHRDQSQRRKIRQGGETLPEAVGDIGHDHHDHQPQNIRHKLFAEIVSTAAEILLGLVGTGGIDHHQAEAHQKQHHKQQAVVKKILCLFFFSLLSIPASFRHAITPQARLHSP